MCVYIYIFCWHYLRLLHWQNERNYFVSSILLALSLTPSLSSLHFVPFRSIPFLFSFFPIFIIHSQYCEIERTNKCLAVFLHFSRESKWATRDQHPHSHPYASQKCVMKIEAHERGRSITLRHRHKDVYIFIYIDFYSHFVINNFSFHGLVGLGDSLVVC